MKRQPTSQLTLGRDPCLMVEEDVNKYSIAIING